MRLETRGTGGNYSEKESEKYKHLKDKGFSINRFASHFHIEDTEEDMVKKFNKDKNDEEVVNNN